MKFEEKTLGDLFNDNEIEDIEMILKEEDWDYLRKWLNQRKEKLLKKGVVADYLFYYLQNQFR